MSHQLNRHDTPRPYRATSGHRSLLSQHLVLQPNHNGELYSWVLQHKCNYSQPWSNPARKRRARSCVVFRNPRSRSCRRIRRSSSSRRRAKRRKGAAVGRSAVSERSDAGAFLCLCFSVSSFLVFSFYLILLECFQESQV